MARKNRVSVYDGVYHVTTRIAHKAMLLKPEEVKERILELIYDTAAFSGVEIWGFAIMDNHLHLIVHVPPVPQQYWLDPKAEPDAWAFGMRPPENREPLWSPAVGDSPRGDGRAPVAADRLADGDCPRRPAVGFTLPDGEMLARLGCLYSASFVEGLEKGWDDLRRLGMDAVVEAEKAVWCRRMYNLSQYLKTLKESIGRWYNKSFKHEGGLWQGRFYSGVVQKKREVYAIVAAYVAYNPVKAKIAASPAAWRWSSYGLAMADDKKYGPRCRAGYERMFGEKWEDVAALLESVYADELPPGVTPEEVKEQYDNYDPDAVKANGEPRCPPPAYRASQAVRVSMKVFRTGEYIGDDPDFLKAIRGLLPRRFPCAGKRSLKRCLAFFWELPERLRQAA